MRARHSRQARVRIPCRERAFGRTTDHRSVGERIGERKAELDDVGAALDRRRRELRRFASRTSDRRRASSSVVCEEREQCRVDASPPWRRYFRLTPSRTKPRRSSTRSDAVLPTRTCASTRQIPFTAACSVSLRTDPGRDAQAPGLDEEPVTDLDDVAQRIEMMKRRAAEQFVPSPCPRSRRRPEVPARADREAARAT